MNKNINNELFKTFNDLHLPSVILKKDNNGDFILVDYILKSKEMDGITDKFVGKKINEFYKNIDEFGIIDVFNKVYDDGISRNHSGYYADGKIKGYRDSYIYRIKLTDDTYNIVSIYDDNTEIIQMKRFNKLFRNILKYRKYITVFIISCIFSIIFLNFNNNVYDKLYDKYYDKNEIKSICINRGNDVDILWRNAMDEFNNKNYTNTISILERIKDNNSVYFYIGVSYMNLEYHEKSIIYFNKVLDNDNIFYSNTLWLLSLNYLANGDLDKCKEMLNIILEDSGNYKYDEAKSLMKKL